MPGKLILLVDNRTILPIASLVLMLAFTKIFLRLSSIMQGTFDLINYLSHLFSEVLGLIVDG